MILKTFILSILVTSTYASHNDGTADVGLFVFLDPEGDVPVIDFSTKSSQCEPLKQYARLELNGALVCQYCGREKFLETYNAVADSTTTTVPGTKHGICCQNSHHKVCKAMIKEYKLRCEYETESTRQEGNFDGSVYGKGVDSGATCNELQCVGAGCAGDKIANGEACTAASDCTSSYCKNDGTCGSCSDDGACADGVSCGASSHCASNYCNNQYKCGTCGDDSACIDGESCNSDSDCTSNYCNNQYKCAPCKDANSGKCTSGDTCDANEDCQNNYCTTSGVCGTCADDGACADGDTCSSDSDCTSNYCNNQYKCAPCKDANNGKCANGDTCDANEDCSSGTCTDGLCTQVCTAEAPCDVGGTCDSNDKCLTGFCYLTNPNSLATDNTLIGTCSIAVCAHGITPKINDGYCTPPDSSSTDENDRYKWAQTCADRTVADCLDVMEPNKKTCCALYSIDDLPCTDDNWYAKTATNSQGVAWIDEDSEFCDFFPSLCTYDGAHCVDNTKYDCMDTNDCADGEVCKENADCSSGTCTDYKCAAGSTCTAGSCPAGDGCFDSTCAPCSTKTATNNAMYCDGEYGDSASCYHYDSKCLPKPVVGTTCYNSDGSIVSQSSSMGYCANSNLDCKDDADNSTDCYSATSPTSCTCRASSTSTATCSYTNQVSCDADAGCQWLSQSNMCTQSAANSGGGGGGNTCSGKCANYAANGNMCYENEACETNSDCDYGTYCDTCVCTAAKTIGTACSAHVECLPGTYCNTTCTAVKRSGETCSANEECGHGTYCSNAVCTTKKSVGDACSNSAECSSDYCNSNGVCADKQPNGGTCTVPADCQTGLDCVSNKCETTCTQSSDCESAWDNENNVYKNKCVGSYCTTCAAISSQSTCGSTSGCIYDTGTNACRDKDCKDYTNQAECNNQQGECSYITHGGTSSCRKTECGNYDDQPSCDGDSRCSYSNGMCNTKCTATSDCNQHDSEAVCGGGYCTHCPNLDQTTCSSTSECYYKSDGSCIFKQCNQDSDCHSGEHCYEGQCHQCYAHSNEANCNAQEECEYDSMATWPKCKIKDGQYCSSSSHCKSNDCSGNVCMGAAPP